jgi:cobaltochelatase CobS
LDEATLDRFRMGTVPMDYDEVLESVLCPDDKLRTRLQRYRSAVAANRLERIVSTRFLVKAFKMKSAGWSDEKIDSKLFSGWTADEIRKVGGK